MMMSNLVEDLKYIDWQLFNLHRSVFAGKKNRNRDRTIKKLVEDRSKINSLLFPKRKKY